MRRKRLPLHVPLQKSPRLRSGRRSGCASLPCDTNSYAALRHPDTGTPAPTFAPGSIFSLHIPPHRIHTPRRTRKVIPAAGACLLPFCAAAANPAFLRSFLLPPDPNKASRTGGLQCLQLGANRCLANCAGLRVGRVGRMPRSLRLRRHPSLPRPHSAARPTARRNVSGSPHFRAPSSATLPPIRLRPAAWTGRERDSAARHPLPTAKSSLYVNHPVSRQGLSVPLHLRPARPVHLIAPRFRSGKER